MTEQQGCPKLDTRDENTVRAARAAKVLDAYTAAIGDGESPFDAVADLLADLRHYCDAAGLDFESADARAQINHDAEAA